MRDVLLFVGIVRPSIFKMNRIGSSIMPFMATIVGEVRPRVLMQCLLIAW